MRSAHRQTVILFALIAIVLGVLIVVQTARVGGGVGYLFGALFVGLGAGRLYLVRRR